MPVQKNPLFRSAADENHAMTIIGLHGPAQSGKDTVGSYMARSAGFATVAIADGIKKAALELNPVVDVAYKQGEPLTFNRDKPVQYLRRLDEIVREMGWEDAKKIPEVRRLLQAMGIEAGVRIHGPNLWTGLVDTKISALRRKDISRVVVTDIRTADDIDWLISRSGVLWHLQRPDADTALDPALRNHATEATTREVPSRASLVLNNAGSLDDLYHHIDSALDAMR